VRTLPTPRGPISGLLLEQLPGPVGDLPPISPAPSVDPLGDEDLQLSLYLCYELHYRGLPGVDDRWEWEPSLLALRAVLEQQFEEALLAAVPIADSTTPADEIDLALRAIAAEEAPALASYIQRKATLAQIREFVVHRSAYQLKEADPHSWVLPRLEGGPKAALVEIQADEYGGGRAEWIHAELFASAMRALGLDSTYGAYLDLIPGTTLATVNQMSFFGLHRRWRGAIVGHLALFEMTSSIPNRRYAAGLRRLGFRDDATLFFDEHVEADAVHEHVAAVDLAGGLVHQDPALACAVLWGARTLSYLAARWASGLLRSWSEGTTSLLRDLEAEPLELSEAVSR
jgi:Iron-containing redox enzyme